MNEFCIFCKFRKFSFEEFFSRDEATKFEQLSPLVDSILTHWKPDTFDSRLLTNEPIQNPDQIRYNTINYVY